MRQRGMAPCYATTIMSVADDTPLCHLQRWLEDQGWTKGTGHTLPPVKVMRLEWAADHLVLLTEQDRGT